MLKSKAKKFNARQTEDAKQRFSIRKYSFGATSVLLGFSFMLMGAGSVSADTTTPAQTSTERVADAAASSESSQTTSEATENSTKNDATSTETQSSSTTESTNEAASQTAEKSTSDSSSDSSSTEAKENTDSSASTKTADSSTTSASTESTDQAAATTASQSTEDEKAATTTDAASTTAEETKDEIAAQAKQTSTDENTDKAAATSSSDRLVQGKSLTLSTDEIGYTSSTGETTGTRSSITSTISFTGEVGDKFTLKVPTNVTGEDVSVLYGINSYTKSSIADTTVTQDNTAGYYYVTSILKEAGSLTQKVVFTSVKSQMTTLGDSMVDSASIGSREMEMILSAEDADGNNLGSVSETFTQIMKPTIDPELTRTPDKKYQTTIQPNKDYTYSLSLNELLGINNASDVGLFSSNRVIRNINYGTEIRIPVPAQFELNTSDTALKNAFGDQTTITQDGIGADVVITVPKGSGNNVDTPDSRQTPYYIVGKYVFDGNVNQTVTADSPITISQYLDDAHTKTLTGNLDITWSENVNSEITKGNASLGGYGAWIGNELVLNDKADKLTTFAFGNLSSYDLTDVSFDIKVADGFNATGITTPKVDGTSTYSYVLTYADGTTSSGTVNAGEAIKATGGSPIREAILTADYWKAGAKTDGAGVAMDSNTKLQRFTITGNLSDTYDDGSAVKTGDSLTNSMTVSSDYLKGATQKVTQTIVPEYMSSFRIYESGGTGFAGESQKLTIFSNKDMSVVQNEYLNKPVIYVVLPQYAVYNDTASKFYGDPTVSTFYVNDGANQVVKLDYSNSNYQYNIRNDNYTIVADISNDALPGTYQSHFFVRTTTKMMYMTPVNYNTLYKPEYTEGDSTNVWTDGISTNKFSLTVLAPSEEFTMGAMNEGNLDTTFQNTGKSFSTGVQDMKFKITPKNLTKGDLTNVRIYSNLPTESDVNLTGPVTTTDTNAKIYYSTSRLDLNSDTEENVTWLTEDQITDWSTIKSIKVQEDTLAQSTPSNQFSIVIPAKDVNLASDVGKTLNLGYKAYADQFVTPIKKSIATSVIILGPVAESRTVTRTINVHLPSGEVQTTKQEATITRTGVMDKAGNITYTDWTTSSWSEFSNVPDVPGFTPSQKVVTEETVDSNTTDVTIDITYTGNTQKALVNYVDQDKNNALIENSGDLTGASATTIGYSTEDTIKKLVAAGYILVSSDYPTDPVYDTNDNVDQVYTVVLKHGQETVNQEQNVKRTVVYEVPAGFDAPESETETLTFKRTGVKDTVTGEIKWDAADPQSLKTVASPKIAGLTPNKKEVASEKVTPTFDGDKSSTVVVVYTPNIQNALVNYVDEDKNYELIENSGDLSGLSKDMINYSTAETIQKLVNAGYVFVSSNYPDDATYDTDDNTDQIYTVVLKHGQKAVSHDQNVKRTVVYEVPAGFDTPESVEETLSFTQTGTQDLVTGEITWNPVDPQSLKTVTSPKIAGLTADKKEVASEVVTPTFDGDKETTVKVVYTPNIQNALVRYVDEDKNYELIEDSGNMSGLSKDLIGYSTADTIQKLVDAGYVFVSSDYPTDAAYDTDDNTDQIYTVVLKHAHQSVDRDQNVTRTVVYEVPAGFDAPESVEETLSFTQTGDQDMVTKEITWVPVDSQSLKSVTSPTISGLTPDKDEVASQEVVPTFDGDKETTVKVVYTANKQKALVRYVDQDKNNALIKDSGELSGLSKETIAYSTEDTIKKLVDAGYVFVSSDYPSDAAYDTDDSTDQIYTVVLKHGQATVSRDQKVTQNVVYEVPAGFETPSSVTETVSFTQTGTQDLVTKEITWAPVDSQSLKSVTSPTISGLTPDKDEVASQEVIPTFDGDKETTVKVVYTANKQKALVNYVDQDKNNALIEDSGELSGLSKDLIGYSTEDTIKKLEAAGYVFVSSDYPSDAAYDTDDSTDQIYTVVLKHGQATVSRDQKVTQNVVYEVPAGFETPNSVSETVSFTQTGTQDLVTKEITWVPVDSQSLKTVTSPTISGLTPDKDEVASQEVVPTFDGDKETTVKVVYTANKQKALVNYVDADKNNELIEDSGELSGLSKETIAYSTEDTIKKLEAAGYVFVSSDYPSDAAYDTDDSTDQVYTVVLKHGQATVSRDQKVTQNVVYEVPAGFETPSSVTETVSFTQTGTQDLVTKEITWVPVDSQSLKTVTSPNISGLTPDKDEVASQEVVPTFDGDKETTVKVVYTANKQKALVRYIDQDGNNAVIETSGDLTGSSKDAIAYSTEDTIKKLEAAGYVFVSSDYPSDAAYDNDDSTDQVYTVVLKHQTQERVNTKDAKQTVYYVGTGLQLPDKVQTEKDAFKQVVVVDLVTGKVVEEGPWTGQKTFGKETVSVINGYHSDKKIAGGLTATPDQPEVEETVTYVPNGRVILVDKNGQQLPGTSRDQYTTDPEDPTKVLDVVVPEVKGYQPQTEQVGQKLTPSDPSGDTYIVYDVAAQPVEPSKPTEPTTPETQVEPSTPEQPTVPSKPETPAEPTTPDQPTEPTKPATPVEPTTPDQPTEPTNPATPVEPTTPDQPSEPTTPETPVEPSTPDQPTVPSKPVTPAEPAQPEQPTEPTTPETPVEPSTPDQPTVPSKPATPAEPAQPEQPSVPSKPATPAEPKTTEKTNTPASPVATASQTSQKTSPSKKLTAAELPQTGSDDKQSSEMTLMGAILLALSAATGFVTGKKRKKD
ncbi:mucin-binding protein [Lactobacillus delbrueckii]